MHESTEKREADLADLILQLKMNQARKEPLSIEMVDCAIEILGKHVEEMSNLFNCWQALDCE